MANRAESRACKQDEISDVENKFVSPREGDNPCPEGECQVGTF